MQFLKSKRMNSTADNHYTDTYSLYLDVMPLALRELHRYNEMFVGALSLALNATLIALLVTERNKTLEAYRRVLLQNCVVDLVATVAPFVTQVQADFIDGQLIVVLNGMAGDLPLIPYHYALVCFYGFATGAAIIVPTIFFYFRYSLIINDHILTNRQFAAVLSVMVACSLNQGVALALSLLLNHNAAREAVCHRLLSHPIWRQGPVAKCLVSNANDFFLRYFLTCALVMDVIVGAVMSYCTLRIVRHLNEVRSSPKTAQLQKQLNRMFTFQMIIPFFAGILPIVVVTSCTTLRVTVPGAGILATAAMTWLPLVSPFTTIFFVTNFRRRLLHYIYDSGNRNFPAAFPKKVWGARGVSVSFMS